MNTIDVSHQDASFRKNAPKKFVLAYLGRVLAQLELDNVEFSVSFVNEDEMHSMNLQYRGIDDSTDILSFAAEDEAEDGFAFVSAGRRRRVLGDMVICLPVMSRNAAAFGVSDREELCRLLIHGVLHLSGENHETNDPTEPMLVRQESVLKTLGTEA
ncbi:MAG: rRNA maturation RNase YbeY [Spirochaetales bacterium]|nr:rRNA maturation RNase YbeY [Spirochaetales bacterium]